MTSMKFTIDLPEALPTRLNAQEQSLSQVLEVGLDELIASPQTGFTGFAEVLEFLANLSTPKEILALRPSETLQAQIDQLSEKHKAESLTPQEKHLWQQYEYLEHVISMAKAKAYLKLNPQ
ncbi:hypothetical protein [Leptolyngbya sp. UWPOB_LEPTO1]|uniref:hypothetical protein n=1 Tax=Leptolyngbya sp. UWPOB_LEPTO1 TaxID=2815653 RepID=UPI00257C4444|nr:hypothetical protein [Leptolyngbya sp. UWPOB_LEPTO1]